MKLEEKRMTVQKSFLKWVGGKSRIIDQLLPHLPVSNSLRLVEPFVGAGNVFVNTNYNRYLLSDKNSDLINVYVWLKNDLTMLINATKKLFDNDVDFYQIRTQFNCQLFMPSSLERAAAFVYLNRHCFNGICRYNQRGEFNVPSGKYKRVYFPQDELIAFSNKLISVPTDVMA
ncbi:Dam family site-specific DNA-(adenine-N6)-methyltransferase, partial [Gilliamella sp. B2717]|uniref:Dam family site-specific DNA-(adenine-N6)-methyltransferase n=1 Tax=Gilliamella sp. B2717 TaxID=2817996 RepID=UPI00226AF9AC